MADSKYLTSANSEKVDKKIALRAVVIRLMPFVLFLVLGVIAITPFFSRTERNPATGEMTAILWTNDIPNHLMMSIEFEKGLKSGLFYPRWLAGVNNGYGIATMIFYPPGFPYLSSLVHMVIGDWNDTYLLLSILALATSGAAFYGFARRFFDRRSSCIAGLFYMLFPFHLFNLYYQGAMAQLVGYVFMPLVLTMAYRLGLGGRWRDYGLLGLCYGLYLLTHLPVGYLFTYALALYAVLWAVRARDLKILLRIAAGMTLGLLLSSIYWLPAALESKYIYEWATELMPYHTTYMTVLEFKNSFQLLVNWSFILLAGALALSIWALRAPALEGAAFDPSVKPVRGSAHEQIRLWQILGALALFMVTGFSLPISQWIPRIQVATPAWRWLAIAMFFISLVVCAAVERLLNQVSPSSMKLWGYRAAFGILIGFSLWLTARYAIGEPVRNQELYYFPVGHKDSGFTPKDATAVDQLPDTPPVVLSPAEGRSEILRWDPQSREIVVQVDAPSELRLKTYNFPGWVARLDGQETPIATDKDGAQVIALPPGKHRVETTFVNTPPRKAGTALAGFSLLIIFGLVAAGSWPQARKIGKPEDTGDQFGLVDSLPPAESPPALDASPVGRKQYLVHLAGKPLIMALALLIVLAAVVIGFRLFRTDNRKASNPAAYDTDRSGSAAGGAGTDGSGRRLSMGAREFVPVAIDERALDEMLNFLSKADEDKLKAMVDAKRVLQVSNQTSVRVLSMQSGRARVELTDGEHIFQQGWVPETWIK